MFKKADCLLGNSMSNWRYLFEYLIYYYYKLFPDQDYLKQSYHQPQKVKFSSVRPKNLLLIYVESIEASYQDTSVFHRNLVHSLQELPGAISFEKFSQMRGSDWSLGGLIASHCGIPVKLIGRTILDKNIFGRFFPKFLPGAICLSDVLAQQHYHNVYMNGASQKFAGFDHFLKTHHYHERTFSLGAAWWCFISAGHPKIRDTSATAATVCLNLVYWMSWQETILPSEINSPQN